MSGMLYVTSETISRRIYFTEGRLNSAKTTFPPEHLGEILISEGKISRTQLENAIKIKKATPYYKKIGEILIETANLKTRDVYHALIRQLITITTACFSLTQGQWQFMPEEKNELKQRNFNIKLPEVIRTGLKHVPELTFYKQKFGPAAITTHPLLPDILDLLTPAHISFHNYISGFPRIPADQFISKLDARMMIDGFTPWEIVLFFYLIDALDFSETAKTPQIHPNSEEQNEQHSTIEELNELYERINRHPWNYYQLFGVKPSASVEEINQKYFDFSHKFHPDRIHAAADSNLMRMANDVFAEINAGYAVLTSPTKRREYDAQISRDGAELEDPAKRARHLYAKATSLYRQIRYPEAARLLEDAISIDNSKASYFLLLGLCQSKLEGNKQQAETNLKKAAELQPLNADPVFALGELYRSENLIKNAEACFKKALKIDAHYFQAEKALKDMAQKVQEKKPRFSFFRKKHKKE